MRWVLDSNVWIEAAAGIRTAGNAVVKAGTIEWAGYSAISRLENVANSFTAISTARRLSALLRRCP